MPLEALAVPPHHKPLLAAIAVLVLISTIQHRRLANAELDIEQ